MSEMDVAKMMFGWANESGTMLGSPSASSPSSASNVRYGTVTAVNDDGTYEVTLDTGETVTMESDTPLEVGDRVSLVSQNGSWVLYSMGTFVRQVRNTHLEIAEAIEAKGEEILASAKADLDEVNAAFEEFKATHALTDEDIVKTVEESASATTTRFEAMIEDLDETYVTEAELKAGIDELSSTFSETYASETDLGAMEKELQSQIAQNAEAIQTEVSDRTAAVSGALSEAKSYTDQQAGSITQTVEQSVMNSVGETYATKTELEQTSDSLSVSISGAVSTANSAKSTASSAYSKASDSEDFIETHFEATTSGLTVSSSASSYKTRVTSSSFDVLTSSDALLVSMGVSSVGYPVISAGSAYGSFALQGDTSYGWLRVGSSVDVDGMHSDFALRRTGGLSEAGYYKAWWTLYRNSSGTAGTVTLSISASRFSEIVIVFKDGDSAYNSTVVTMFGSTVYATLLSSYMTNGVIHENKQVKISGTSITNYSGGRSYVQTGGEKVDAASDTAYISIVAVYGLHT